jgi:hypothetical protein
MLNAPIAAPARYVAFPFMICAPLKIPLKSFIPNTIAITDEPVETIPSSNIRNKKNTYLLNFSMASMGPIILKPKGFPGTRRKNAMPEIKASIPKTNDSKDVLLYLFSSIKSFIKFLKNNNIMNLNYYKNLLLLFILFKPLENAVQSKVEYTKFILNLKN